MSRYFARIYKDRAGEWRWQVIATNRKIVAVSGEGYVKQSHATEMVSKLFTSLDRIEVRPHEATDTDAISEE